MKICSVLVLIAVIAAFSHSASISNLGRQKRTLGLLTVAGDTLSTSVEPVVEAASEAIGSAGAAATTALTVASAVKPLILLGLGKYALWNLLSRPGGISLTAGAGGNNLGVTAGFNSGYGGYKSEVSIPEPVLYVDEPSFIDNGGEWVEEPAYTPPQQYSKW